MLRPYKCGLNPPIEARTAVRGPLDVCVERVMAVLIFDIEVAAKVPPSK